MSPKDWINANYMQAFRKILAILFYRSILFGKKR